jgi:hypothetical protein
MDEPHFLLSLVGDSVSCDLEDEGPLTFQKNTQGPTLMQNMFNWYYLRSTFRYAEQSFYQIFPCSTNTVCVFQNSLVKTIAHFLELKCGLLHNLKSCCLATLVICIESGGY